MMAKDIEPLELDFLLRFPCRTGVTSPVDFITNHQWGGIKVGVNTGLLSMVANSP